MSKKCTWKDEDVPCENIAVEKWTTVPYIDPYCGPFDGSEYSRTDYYCKAHVNFNKKVFLEECKMDQNKADQLIKQLYIIDVI